MEEIEEFLRDPGSTTGYFSQLSHDYQLEILKHGINGEYFERIIAIYLNGVPCIVAISKTRVDSPVFFDILRNAGQVPIGTKLFATDANITRTNLDISIVAPNDIKNSIIANFIASISIESKGLYYRTSDFVFEDQIMHLDEYALPGLTQILKETSL